MIANSVFESWRCFLHTQHAEQLLTQKQAGNLFEAVACLLTDREPNSHYNLVIACGEMQDRDGRLNLKTSTATLHRAPIEDVDNLVL